MTSKGMTGMCFSTAPALSNKEGARAPDRNNFGLDAVRATAITTVVIAHGLSFIPGALNAVGVDFLGLLYALGVVGVEIFFCLSGFLIGKILLDIQDSGLTPTEVRVFLIRRWMRTLPLYYLVLIALILWPPLFPNGKPVIWPFFVMGQNLFAPMPESGWFGQSWSLTIEEWSYVVLPLLAFALQKRTRRPVLTAALILCAFGLAARTAMALRGVAWSLNDWDVLLRKMAVTRFDAIGYGVVAASLLRTHAAVLMPWLRRLFPLSMAAALVNAVLVYRLQPLSGAYGLYFAFPAMAASFCMIIPVMTEVRPPSWLVPPVRFVARISYALYLSHLSVVFLIQAYAPAVGLPGFLLAALAVGAVLSYGFEQPIMRLRPKSPSTRPALAAAPA